MATAVVLGSSSLHAHDIQPPRPLQQPTAPWPEGKASSHDLVVPVMLVIDEEGNVTGAEVDVSVGEPFDSIALETARRWKFAPATGEKGPVSARIRAAVRFVGVKPPEQPHLHDHGGGAHEHPHGPAAGHAHGADEKPRHDHEHATETGQPVHAVGHGEDEHRDIDEVLVEGPSAARAASGTVHEREVLEAAPHRTASDLLTTVPGVFVTQHSGEGKAHQIFFRGFDAVHGQDLEIWVGGAPVNEVSNIHGQGYADMHFVMPEVVRRIEALPGTYDPHQGDFAVAGTLRLHLGYDEPGVTGSVKYGSWNTRRAFIGYHPADLPETTFAAFEAYQTDGFGAGRAADRVSGIGQVEAPLGRELKVRVLATTYGGRFGSPGVLRQDDVNRGEIGRFDSYDTNQGGSSQRLQLVTELVRNDGDSRLTLAPYVVQRALRLRFNFTGYLEDEVAGDSIQQINDSTTVGAHAAYRRTFHLFRNHDAVEAGLFVRNDWVQQSQKNVAIDDGRLLDETVDARVRATSVGGYVDTALHPIPRVEIRGGVRVDGVSFATEDRLSNSASRSSQGVHVGEKGTLDVAIVPRLHGLLSWGRGFRTPQARSLADGERTPLTRVRSAEVGFRYADAKYLRAQVAGFRTWLSDDIAFDETLARNETIPGTLRHGLAAHFESNPTPWFTSAFGITYTRAEVRNSGAGTTSGPRLVEGDLLPFVPQVVARSDMAFRPVVGEVFGRDVQLTVGTGMQYLYRRPLPFGEIGSNVFLLDAKAGVRVREIELGLETFNLLDVAWNDGEFVYASNFDRGSTPSLVPVRHFTAGAPRGIFLTLALYI